MSNHLTVVIIWFASLAPWLNTGYSDSISRLLELHEYDDIGDDYDNETCKRDSAQAKESHKVEWCRIGQSPG
jgi:hypothetical protein